MKNIPIRSIDTTRQEPDLSGSFGIRDIRELLAGKDMLQDLHRHDFFFMLVLKKGTGEHTIDFTSFEVGDNMVFCMRPGQVHQLVLKAGSTGYLLQFKREFYHLHDRSSSQLLHKVSSRNCYRLDAKQFKKLALLLTAVLQEYTDQQQGYQDVIKSSLGILFVGLLRQNSNNPDNTVNPYTQERLEEFSAFLETHIVTHKQASQYADLMHLSLHQLNTITKTTLGKTSSALINEHIMLESKRQLLATTAQVKEIADQLGYEDVSYFIRFFKKHSGYSPDAFRQKFK